MAPATKQGRSGVACASAASRANRAPASFAALAKTKLPAVVTITAGAVAYVAPVRLLGGDVDQDGRIGLTDGDRRPQPPNPNRSLP
jgi:hypothetical protein